MAENLEVFNSAHTGAAIDAAVSAVKQKESKWDGKQDKLTGKQGQVVGFDANGNAQAQAAPQSGMTQEAADKRYLQLTGGTIASPDKNHVAILRLDGRLCLFDSGLTGFGVSIEGSISTITNRGAIRLTSQDPDETEGNVVLSGIDYPKYEEDAANKGYVDGLTAHQATVTLTVAGWASKAQTVSVAGILKDQTKQVVDVAPADTASRDAWAKAGIWCTDPTADGQLTFTCDTVPTVAVNVRVRWQGVAV